MLNSFIRGLRLGIILQLSIGPVCLFILQTAIARGITEALKAVLAVVLVDAFYILLALYGLGTCLKNYPGIQKKLRYCGAAVLLYFAVTALADVFHPQVSTATIMLPQISSFYAAGLLTLSNPLTIIFWLGMLSAQVSQYRSIKNCSLYQFDSYAQVRHTTHQIQEIRRSHCPNWNKTD